METNLHASPSKSQKKAVPKTAEKIDVINQIVKSVDLQNAIITNVDSINNTIDLLYTRDNCLIDSKNFTIMNVTQY